MELNNNIITSNKKIRSTKKDLYKKEQEEILHKINTIIGVSKDNNTAYLYDIENDKDKRDKILALSDDVKKYFKSSKWGFYCKEECRDNHVLLCKSVYKDMGYKIISNSLDITRNIEKIRTTKYTIGKITIEL